jgi:hypothetical protein
VKSNGFELAPTQMESNGLVDVVVDCRDHSGLAASGSLKTIAQGRPERVDFRVR